MSGAHYKGTKLSLKRMGFSVSQGHTPDAMEICVLLVLTPLFPVVAGLQPEDFLLAICMHDCHLGFHLDR